MFFSGSYWVGHCYGEVRLGKIDGGRDDELFFVFLFSKCVSFPCLKTLSHFRAFSESHDAPEESCHKTPGEPGWAYSRHPGTIQFWHLVHRENIWELNIWSVSWRKQDERGPHSGRTEEAQAPLSHPPSPQCRCRRYRTYGIIVRPHRLFCPLLVQVLERK